MMEGGKSSTSKTSFTIPDGNTQQGQDIDPIVAMKRERTRGSKNNGIKRIVVDIEEKSKEEPKVFIKSEVDMKDKHPTKISSASIKTDVVTESVFETKQSDIIKDSTELGYKRNKIEVAPVEKEKQLYEISNETVKDISSESREIKNQPNITYSITGENARITIIQGNQQTKKGVYSGNSESLQFEEKENKTPPTDDLITKTLLDLLIGNKEEKERFAKIYKELTEYKQAEERIENLKNGIYDNQQPK